MPGRGWGLFTVKVPADFGDNKITWTIVANGKTTAIPASLKPEWEVSPFLEAAVGNTPPVLSFDQHGPSVQGPRGLMVERSAKVGEPLAVDRVGFRRRQVHFLVRREAQEHGRLPLPCDGSRIARRGA